MVDNPPGLSVSEAVRRYQQNSNVVYAEPDYVLTTVTTPTDPMWSQQWDMTKISAPTAWSSQTSASDVVVAVIDTGIDFTHQDLQANLWVDPTNSANHGFTCMNGVCSPGGQDDFGHGTHVAGTIGAVANNGAGIAGINWRVQLFACKFLDSTGSGYVSDAVLCFNQVLTLKQQGVNIRVTSNSWGGGGFDQSLQDAMSAVEAAGIVNVCAAGNSAVNADVWPMYPAAFNNRGIVSVLASDSNDLGAGFTNYGLANVDIAAPGANTLSTVPTGSCALCDPSGYKLLSGTSMATPHVSGVLAALLHKNPALTAAQARDVVLDPASYDALTDALARSTSTGGRLNFAKALANPLLSSPKLNNFPTLTMPADVFTTGGSTVNITPTMSDPDNDPLRGAWAKTGGWDSAWLFGWMINSLFPNPAAGSVSFTAPSLARTAMVGYELSIADGRGGGAEGLNHVTVSPVSNPGAPPSGSLSVSSTNPPAGSTITVNFPVTAPAGGQPGWAMWVSSAASTIGYCCFTGTSASVGVGSGVYRISAQAIDRQLNLSARSTVAVNAGGATGQPPVAAAALDKLSGAVPFTVNIDMSGSYDPDGTIQSYYMNCGLGAFTAGAQASSGSCTFTTPGSYWMYLQVHDNSGNVDTMDAYVVATPAGGGGGGGSTPPTVSISSPASSATVSGNVSISANASSPVGIKKVDFYRDAAVLLGTATASPYTITWNSGSVAAGAHSLYAIATDTGSLTTTSATVAVTVATPPTVSITSPAASSTVSGSVAITASASDALGIKKVDFYLDAGVLLGTATASPYTMTWNSASVTAGAHNLYAIATNTAALTTTSATVAITVNTNPTVSLTSPAANSTVTGSISITANASDSLGIKKVDFYLDAGVLLGTATASPYTITWNSGSVTAGAHSLYAIATDDGALTATSVTVAVTVATPPTVSITSPAASSTVSGSVAITASASDALGIKKVDFYLDAGVLLGTATASPYTITWNSASVTAGAHNLYAIATNTAALTTTSATVAITVGTGATISITSPAANSTVTGSISITANASDSLGIKKVDFYLDAGVLLGTATASPYTITWNSGSVTAGAHSLYAIATDNAAMTATSAKVAITVATPPTVSITSPAANSTVSGSVAITASASDTLGIRKVDFYLDAGVLLGTATASPYTMTWNSGSVATGAHSLYAIATDTAALTTTSATVAITVGTGATISITSPAPNALVWGSVAVMAAVSGTGIQSVAFYLDSTVLIGTATTSPYSITWNAASVTPGTHTLSAIATTTALTSKASTSVSVMVDAPPQVTISTQPNSSTVAKKSTVTINAAVTQGGFPVSRIDFLVNSTVVCSDTTTPYSCSWQVPASPGKIYQLTAKAYDTQGQVGTSSVISVTSK